MTRRRLTLAVVALLVVTAGLGALGAPALGQEANTTATSSTSTPTPTPTAGEISDDRPPIADRVRVLPVRFDREFLGVETVERNQVYNTTGPWVQFSLSEPVSEAVISEPGADVRILGDGTVVKVAYDPNAAAVGKQSLYHLRLFFADASELELELYASRTSVDVGSTQLAPYREPLDQILDNTESAGYDRSPEGLQNHYGDLQETAQLLESLFTQQALRFVLHVWGIVTNPVGIAVILLGIAVAMLYFLKRRAWVLEVLTNDSGKAKALREKLWLQYKRQQQTAADESLAECPGIDGSREIYWRDAYGVETVAGLAELFRRGVPVERNGQTQTVGGIDELEAEGIHDSWLEAVCRDGRIPAPQLALSDGKNALHRMISKYGQGHIYQGAYEQTAELIDDLDESQSIREYAVGGRSTSNDDDGGSGSPAGGDD